MERVGNRNMSIVQRILAPLVRAVAPEFARKIGWSEYVPARQQLPAAPRPNAQRFAQRPQLAQPRLDQLVSDLGGETFEVKFTAQVPDGFQFELGRSEANGVNGARVEVGNRRVSGVHAKITYHRDGNRVTVQDLGSTNGTTLNRIGIERMGVASADLPVRVQLGGDRGVTLILMPADQPAASSANRGTRRVDEHHSGRTELLTDVASVRAAMQQQVQPPAPAVAVQETPWPTSGGMSAAQMKLLAENALGAGERLNNLGVAVQPGRGISTIDIRSRVDGARGEVRYTVPAGISSAELNTLLAPIASAMERWFHRPTCALRITWEAQAGIDHTVENTQGTPQQKQMARTDGIISIARGDGTFGAQAMTLGPCGVVDATLASTDVRNDALPGGVPSIPEVTFRMPWRGAAVAPAQIKALAERMADHLGGSDGRLSSGVIAAAKPLREKFARLVR